MPKTRFAIKAVSDHTLKLMKDIPEAGCLHACKRVVYREAEIKSTILGLLQQVDEPTNVVVEQLNFESEEDEARSAQHESGLGFLPVVCQTLFARKIKLSPDGKDFVPV